MNPRDDNKSGSEKKMPGEEKCELVMEKLYALNANITWKKYDAPSEKVKL